MQNYKQLQELIKEYEKTKIWTIIDGDDIFKLEGFEENVYVSIMGKAKIDLSIAIYYGNQDLLSQMDITFGQYEFSPDAFIRLCAYKIEIGSPGNMLTDSERLLLKKNHIKPRNVVFRLEAGKLPRLVSEKECSLLIDILKRIIDVSKYVIKNNVSLEDIPSKNMISFKKINKKVEHKKIKWPILKFKFIKQKKLNKDLINKANWITKKGEYNIGLFYSPTFVMETLSYPFMVIIHDAKKDLIIDLFVVNDKEKSEIANLILKSFVTKKIIPAKISFNSNEIACIFDEIIKEFQILFRLDENIERLFDIWNNLYNML